MALPALHLPLCPPASVPEPATTDAVDWSELQAALGVVPRDLKELAEKYTYYSLHPSQTPPAKHAKPVDRLHLVEKINEVSDKQLSNYVTWLQKEINRMEVQSPRTKEILMKMASYKAQKTLAIAFQAERIQCAAHRKAIEVEKAMQSALEQTPPSAEETTRLVNASNDEAKARMLHEAAKMNMQEAIKEFAGETYAMQELGGYGLIKGCDMEA